MADQEKFREIHEILTQFPELHHQNFWEAEPEDNGSCGTTRCVAGWAVWLAAKDMGLMSRKRDTTSHDVLSAVAREHGITDPEYTSSGVLYPVVGARILGLDEDEAGSLFHDMNGARVVRRVASYAETGEDISDEEFDQFYG